MHDRKHRPLLFVIILLAAAAFPTKAEQEVGRKVRLFGDFRLRLEQDWDSLQGDCTPRDDRLRLRIRLRGGLEVRINDNWSAQLAARTGPDRSQQSPHVTVYDFDGGPTGPYDLNLDHWFLSYESGGFEVWAGRNELSFWHQDDLFVFDNVTYAGVGGSYRHEFAAGGLTWSLNYVALSVGMRDTSGTGIIGQVAYERKFESSELTVAGGFFGTNADPGDPAGNILLTDNNRDYRLLDREQSST